jgi:hypothetical protein
MWGALWKNDAGIVCERVGVTGKRWVIPMAVGHVRDVIGVACLGYVPKGL